MIERTPWLNVVTHAILFTGLFILVVPIYLVIVAASQTLPDVMAIPAKLLPGELITPHRDSHPSFHHGHRIHIPIKTNPRVRF